jgi:Family of unknown function (DUF6283)
MTDFSQRQPGPNQPGSNQPGPNRIDSNRVHSDRNLPCANCPWRVDHSGFVWTTERLHDLRLGMLQTIHGQTRPCEHRLEPSPSCGGFRQVSNTRHVRAWLARMRGEHRVLPDSSLLFPSFEAMADVNGAGLFDWIAQLRNDDLVVHFKHGFARTILEVHRSQAGVVGMGVDARSNGVSYRFNALGYELFTVIDSRILPATPASIKLISDLSRASS